MGERDPIAGIGSVQGAKRGNRIYSPMRVPTRKSCFILNRRQIVGKSHEYDMPFRSFFLDILYPPVVNLV